MTGGNWLVYTFSRAAGFERTVQKAMEKATKRKYIYRIFTTNMCKNIYDKTKTIYRIEKIISGRYYNSIL